jgi:hypothetical protein
LSCCGSPDYGKCHGLGSIPVADQSTDK